MYCYVVTNQFQEARELDPGTSHEPYKNICHYTRGKGLMFLDIREEFVQVQSARLQNFKGIL